MKTILRTHIFGTWFATAFPPILVRVEHGQIVAATLREQTSPGVVKNYAWITKEKK